MGNTPRKSAYNIKHSLYQAIYRQGAVPHECTVKKRKEIGKFVILRYDKILHTEYAKPTARKSSKASSKKSGKSLLAKKSAKLT
jgi:hypothetical protein